MLQYLKAVYKCPRDRQTDGWTGGQQLPVMPPFRWQYRDIITGSTVANGACDVPCRGRAVVNDGGRTLMTVE